MSQSYEGQIVHSETGKGVPFANIRYRQNKGVISDIDGRYHFSAVNVDSLLVSYVGYQTVRVKADSTKAQKISLHPERISLQEVVITPKENPAMRIVRNLLGRKKKNNPDSYNNYSYMAYDKLVFTIHEDSVAKYESKTEQDTSFRNLVKFFNKQHLFLMENVTRTNYIHPDKKQEKILASRTSGFQTPIFTLLLSQMQSNSFYENQISIGDKDYINPFTKGSMNKFWFQLEDVLTFPNNDSAFIISFRPRKGVIFEGLQGVVTINSSGWAFENIVAWPSKANNTGINIRIEQNYKQISDARWFPSQQNLTIFLGSVKANGIPLIGRGKRYLFDVEINSKQIPDFNPAIALKYGKQALHDDDNVLKNYRRVPFTEKDLETYRVIDSIGKARNFTGKIKAMQSLIDGDIRIGKADIPLAHLLDRNKYEGWRAGLGFKTNREFSLNLALSAYGAYGFKDKAWKYGFGAEVFFDRYRQHGVQYRYSDDLSEVALYDDRVQLSLFDPATYRDFGISTFSKNMKHFVELRSQVFPFLQVSPFIQKEEMTPMFEYSYGTDNQATDFNFFETGLHLRLAFGEKFVMQPGKVSSLGTKYPVLSLFYQHGMLHKQWGDADYHRLFMKVDDEFKTNLLGTTAYRLEAGIVSKDVPLMKMFYGKGSAGSYFFSPYSFSTMRYDEFYQHRFFSAYLSHHFRQLLVKTKYFSPDISLHHHMQFGKALNKSLHHEVEINDTRKGYFESGVELANILRLGVGGLGISAFYRYGPYSHPQAGDNLSILISLRLLGN